MEMPGGGGLITIILQYMVLISDPSARLSKTYYIEICCEGNSLIRDKIAIYIQRTIKDKLLKYSFSLLWTYNFTFS